MLKKVFPFLTLFSSLSTLVCCALPALFVSLGLGATFVSLLGTFPQLIWLSEHKVAVFALAGALLALTAVMRRYTVDSCPADPALAAQCRRLKRFNNGVYYFSVAAYLIGAFFAFTAQYLLVL